jgi:hypothetical protein
MSKAYVVPTLKVNGQYIFDSAVLEKQLKELISRRVLDSGTNFRTGAGRYEEPLADPLSLECCRTFVLALSSGSISSMPSRLRTYATSYQSPTECHMWEACRATLAHPAFFEPITFGEPPAQYQEAGVGYYNPANEGLSEARMIWPHAKISCLVSIGSRIRPPTKFKGLRFGVARRSQRTISRIVGEISKDCERTAEDVQLSCMHQDVPYYRFSVFHSSGTEIANSTTVPVREAVNSYPSMNVLVDQVSKRLLEDSDIRGQEPLGSLV